MNVIGTIPRVSGVAGAMLCLCSLVPGQGAPDPLEVLMDKLVALRLPPGKKDTADTLHQLLFGYAFWRGDTEQGGYENAIHELAHEDQASAAYPALELALKNTSYKTTPLDDASGSTATLTGDIQTQLFESEWSNFTIAGQCEGEFTQAFTTPAINFFSVQGSIYSPFLVGPAKDVFNLAPFEFPGFMDGLAACAGEHGLAFTQDIGFANNRLFPSNQVDQTIAFPLITKHDFFGLLSGFYQGFSPTNPNLTGQPAVYRIPWGNLFAGTGITPPPPFLNHVMNIAYPEVALEVAEGIRGRVDPTYGQSLPPPAYPAGLPTYHLVGGEYSIQGEPFKDALGYPVCICGAPQCSDPGCIDWFQHVACVGTGDPLCDPCREIGTDSTRYLDCLPNTDYSPASLVHFQCFLADKYGTLQALEAAWAFGASSCGGDIVGCAEIDPRVLADYANNLQQVFDDWIDFQRHQFRESQRMQYRVAKVAEMNKAQAASVHESPAYTLQFGPRGADEGALHSDGVGLGNWYKDNAPRLDRPSYGKLTAIEASSYGESVNFPLFGMPRKATDFESYDPTGCKAPGSVLPPNMPKAFGPACWDYEFSMRLLHEFMTCGVDSLALGYWEAIGMWGLVYGFSGGIALSTLVPPLLASEAVPLISTIKYGTFFPSAPFDAKNIVEYMAEFVVAPWRAKRAFMTPWRSPLLVHLGAAAYHTGVGGTTALKFPAGMTGAVLQDLSDGQFQYAPFADSEGLDDLWLTSEREILLSAFVPDLDAGLLKTYVDAASAHAWKLLILTDVKTIADPAKPFLKQKLLGNLILELGVPPIFIFLGSPAPAGSFAAAWGPSSGKPSAVVVLAVNERLSALTDDAQTLVAQLLPPLLTHPLVAPKRPLRPVLAVAETSSCPGAPLAGIDLSVMTDGVDLMVAVVNSSGVPKDVRLCVSSPMMSLVEGTVSNYEFLTLRDKPGGILHQLGSGDSGFEGLGSELRFASATLSGTEFGMLTVDGDIRPAINSLGSQLPVPGPANNAAAFRAVLDELVFLVNGPPFVSAEDRKKKLLAGLVRLQRMPLLTYVYDSVSKSLTLTVEEFRISGASVTKSVVSDPAPVQIEYPFQNHARRHTFIASGSAGQPLQTTNGMLVLDTDDLKPYGFDQPVSVAAGAIWNFGIDQSTLLNLQIAPQLAMYVRPTWPTGALPHAVEIHVMHPTHHTQSKVTVYLTGK